MAPYKYCKCVSKECPECPVDLKETLNCSSTLFQYFHLLILCTNIGAEY